MNIPGATRQELQRFGFDEAQLERFAKSLRDTPAATQPYVTGTIEQLTPGDASVLTAEHRERGLAALRAGEVGVVILAGGMATRFGGVVKAAVPVTHGKTFLGLKVADVAKLAMPAGRTLGEIAPEIDSIEAAVRAAVPAARIIYFEPDVERPVSEPAPLTDTIILKSEN